MKNAFQLFIQILVISFFSLTSMSVFGFGSGAESSIGTITVKNRPVWVERDGKKLDINSFGLKLEKNDLVKTSDGGQAQVALKNGNNIYIAPNTELVLSEEVIGEEESGVGQFIKLLYGKIRAKIQKTRKGHFRIQTATATIGVKGTDFITEYVAEITRVGTVEGLVNLQSEKTKESVDIPPGSMGSVSVFGELLPVEEFAGELMDGVEFAGKKMEEEDIAGEKIKM